MKYPSAKSFGFGTLVFGVIALLTVCSVLSPDSLRLPVLCGAALVTGLLLWVWFGTRYEFREEHLLLRMGPFFERIPYARIFEANKMKSMLSSMALSSDMIELRHGQNYITGTTYISPRDRDGFLAELRRRCANLRQEHSAATG